MSGGAPHSTSAKPSMRSRMPIIAILVFALIGAGLSYFVALMIAHELGFEAEAQRLDGEVVGFKEHRDHRGAITYAPVFRLATADGRTIDRPSAQATSPVAWSIGEHATVLYDPREPTHVVADIWRERWGPSALLALVASSFFAAVAFGIRTRFAWRGAQK